MKQQQQKQKSKKYRTIKKIPNNKKKTPLTKYSTN